MPGTSQTADNMYAGKSSRKSGALTRTLLLVAPVLSCLLLAAHYLRAGGPGLVLLFVSAPLVLFVKRPWIKTTFSALLIFGAGVWIATALAQLHVRSINDEPWLRTVLILGSVCGFTAGSAVVFKTKALAERYRAAGRTWLPSLVAFAFTGLMLAVVQIKVEPPGMLLERFLPGGGWAEAFWLCVYAAWITDKMLDPAMSIKWRPRIWSLFSLVFFLQLAVGLLGVERFLMTGELHLPIPALIVGGPLYRGGGLFMPVLFLATLLLAGPAWCSHLCYIGAWDDRASRLKAKPRPLPGWRGYMRVGILAGVVVAALLMRRAGVGPFAAAVIASAFGIAGVGVMLTWSRMTGTMAHCTAYCPIGWLACTLGKTSPFRIRINSGCIDCGACSKVCRYDALSSQDIERRRPAESCTLCGDCISECKHSAIGYGFPGLDPARARTLFLVMVVSLHAAFMGLARI